MKDLEATRETATMKPEAVLEGFKEADGEGLYLYTVYICTGMSMVLSN